MKVDYEKKNDVYLVLLEGELDYRVSSDVRAKLNEMMAEKPGKVVVDLQKINYMDSSGIAAFVELSQKMKLSGGKMALFGLSRDVRSVFELAKMHLFFTISDTQEAALQAVGS